MFVGVYKMRRWEIKRVATFSDEELCDAIMQVESNPHNNVKEVIFMGNNPKKVRIYQILYTVE